MIEIDGSQGSGGGQIIRTSLSLATITGQSIRIARIRYGRPQPGLAAQHLTAVRAAAKLCLAKVKGDSLGSTTLEFLPSCPPQAGKYSFDVSEARVGKIPIHHFFKGMAGCFLIKISKFHVQKWTWLLRFSS